MIEPEHPRLSVVRQCELVSISRSGFYYRPAGETPLNLTLMRDSWITQTKVGGQFSPTDSATPTPYWNSVLRSSAVIYSNEAEQILMILPLSWR